MAVVAVAVQVPITAIAWSSPAATCDAATGSHHVALVVQHGDDSSVSRCVAFSGSSLTGEQVLAQSGIEYKTVAFGGLSDAVCQVDGEPATFPPSCWTSTSSFWAFFVARKGGTWFSSSLGISSQTFHDGDAEGFRFEPQDVPLPPKILGSCPSATPTPVVTPRPTPRPTVTSTPPETARPASTPSAGATPTWLPTASDGEPGAASASPSPGGSAAVIAIVATPGPSNPVVAAGSTGNASRPDGDGTPALVVAVAAIVGLAGLAVVRRRPTGPVR